MTKEETAQSQVGEEQEPQAGTTESTGTRPQAGAAESQADEAEGQSSIDPTEVARLRKEAASYRTKLRKFEEAEEARKREAMTEAERVKADREAFEKERQAFATQQREFAAQKAVITEAGKFNFRISADRMWKLVRDEIEYDDDGKPTNVTAVVAQLAKDEPGFIGSANGAPTNPDRQRGGLTADDIRKMSRDELMKLDTEQIQAALSSR